MIRIFSNQFNIDKDTGEFTGLACPYGEVTSDCRDIRFKQHSLASEDGKEIDLLYEHKNFTMVGSGIFTEHEDGLHADGKLYIEDDDFCLKAKAIYSAAVKRGKKWGLSIGLQKIIKYKQVKKVFEIASATIDELSIVRKPAFVSAKVKHVMSGAKEGITHLASDISDQDMADLISIHKLRELIASTDTDRQFEKKLHGDHGLSQKSAEFLTSIVKKSSGGTPDKMLVQLSEQLKKVK
jgi:phage head maturation protease